MKITKIIVDDYRYEFSYEEAFALWSLLDGLFNKPTVALPYYNPGPIYKTSTCPDTYPYQSYGYTVESKDGQVTIKPTENSNG